MLTGELLRYRRRGEEYRVNFIDISLPKYRNMAEALLEIYTNAPEEKLNRGELAELSATVIRGNSEVKIAAGLDKLLLDRTTFSPVLEEDYPTLRRKAFAQSAAEIHNGIINDIKDISLDIYGDLPTFERVQSFKTLDCEALLNRYNLALAQGLLLYAERVEITIEHTEAQELRRLMKYLKFFRLLAEIHRKKNNEIHIEISGPFSLFDTTRKYALQLAEFLPAVCRLPKYLLHAYLNGPKGAGRLELSPKQHLISHYRNFSAYLPEEIRMYHREFQHRSASWKIVGKTPFIDGGNQELIFPDLSFSHPSGKIIHLELFHRWHSGKLISRLEWLNNHPDMPLLLGIDRAIAKDELIWNSWIEKYPDAMAKVWKFRDFPGVETTLRHLDKQISYR